MKKYWFVFCKTDLLLERLSDGTYSVPFQENPPVEPKEWNTIHNITPLGDIEVKTFLIDAPVVGVEGYEMQPLRKSYQLINEALYLKAGKCQEILYWDINTKFCGVCGSPMRMETDISKRCTGCGKEIWPQLATAIICLISKGDELLLVRANNFRHNFFGLVAGFVETGESLEEAVRREVMEETGLTIKNLRYFGSQPWPYPCGLMIGFNAEYVSGELHLQRSELKEGGWFHYKHLPPIPEKLSIARQLIDSFLVNKLTI